MKNINSKNCGYAEKIYLSAQLYTYCIAKNEAEPEYIKNVLR
jgi:hypothetical protein